MNNSNLQEVASSPQRNNLHFPQIQTPKSNKNDILFSFDNRFKVGGMQVPMADSAFQIHRQYNRIKNKGQPFLVEYLNP